MVTLMGWCSAAGQYNSSRWHRNSTATPLITALLLMYCSPGGDAWQLLQWHGNAPATLGLTS